MARKKQMDITDEFKKEISNYYEYLRNQVPQAFDASTQDKKFKTGIILYDEIIGGIPIGRIVAISAPPGAGKTTLMVQLAQQLQRQLHNIIYLDTEKSMSIQRMEELGLDVNNLIYSSPDTLDECYLVMAKQLKYKQDQILKDKKTTNLVITFDSTSQVPTAKEMEDDFNVNTPGLQARVNSQNLKRIIKPLALTESTLIMVNQLRKNIQMGPMSFGQPDEDITGGVQLKFYPNQDIRLRAGGKGNQKDIMDLGINGNIIYVKQVKNRLMMPNIEFPMVLNYENGFSNQLSNFIFLKSIKQEVWKKQKIQNTQFGSTGGWWNIKWQDYEKKFRSQQFEYLYLTDDQFRDHVDSLIITVIRRMFRRVNPDYLFTPQDAQSLDRWADPKDLEYYSNIYDTDDDIDNGEVITDKKLDEIEILNQEDENE